MIETDQDPLLGKEEYSQGLEGKEPLAVKEEVVDPKKETKAKTGDTTTVFQVIMTTGLPSTALTLVKSLSSSILILEEGKIPTQSS